MVVGLTETASPEFLGTVLMVQLKVTFVFLQQFVLLFVLFYCHVQWALFKALRILCYSLRVCCLQRTCHLKAIYE